MTNERFIQSDGEMENIFDILEKDRLNIYYTKNLNNNSEYLQSAIEQVEHLEKLCNLLILYNYMIIMKIFILGGNIKTAQLLDAFYILLLNI